MFVIQIIVDVINAMPDNPRFFLMDATPQLFDMLTALGYGVFEDGSIIKP